MLDKDKFVPLFPGGWWPYIEPFFDKGGFTSIYSHLKERASRHIRIFPLSQDTFRAFQLCPYKGVRAIWEGMCPYHTIWKGQPVTGYKGTREEMDTYITNRERKWYKK